MGYDLTSLDGEIDMTIGAFSMPVFVQMLDEAGPVVDWEVRWDPFPRREDFKELPGGQVNEDDGEPMMEPAFYEAVKAQRSKPSPEPGKVPAFKHGSNDWWIVTPDECRIIAAAVEKVAAAEAAKGAELNPRFVKWGEFAAEAAERGGYTVA